MKKNEVDMKILKILKITSNNILSCKCYDRGIENVYIPLSAVTYIETFAYKEENNIIINTNIKENGEDNTNWYRLEFSTPEELNKCLDKILINWKKDQEIIDLTPTKHEV